MKFEWQSISRSNPGTSSGFATFRAYVPGGWLIRNITWNDLPPEEGTCSQSESMVFVPDTMHSWDLEID